MTAPKETARRDSFPWSRIWNAHHRQNTSGLRRARGCGCSYPGGSWQCSAIWPSCLPSSLRPSPSGAHKHFNVIKIAASGPLSPNFGDGGTEAAELHVNPSRFVQQQHCTKTIYCASLSLWVYPKRSLSHLSRRIQGQFLDPSWQAHQDTGFSGFSWSDSKNRVFTNPCLPASFPFAEG